MWAAEARREIWPCLLAVTLPWGGYPEKVRGEAPDEAPARETVLRWVREPDSQHRWCRSRLWNSRALHRRLPGPNPEKNPDPSPCSISLRWLR